MVSVVVNFYIGFSEEFLFTTENPNSICIKTWWCTVEDIFPTVVRESWPTFQRCLNAQGDSLQFKEHANDQEINFINNKIIKEGSKLATILFKKKQ